MKKLMRTVFLNLKETGTYFQIQIKTHVCERSFSDLFRLYWIWATQITILGSFFHFWLQAQCLLCGW